MPLFQGTRINEVCTVRKDALPFSPARSLRVWSHSPDGFNWGYAGSGPAQLALALLLEVTDQATAVRLHQDFKAAHVVLWKDTWACTSEGILVWIKLQGPAPDHFEIPFGNRPRNSRPADDQGCCG